MRLFIRPTYKIHLDNHEELLGFAVCSTNGDPLIDEQIKEHFPRDVTGKEIKAEFPTAEWGNALLIK